MIGLKGGRKGELDLGALMRKRGARASRPRCGPPGRRRRPRSCASVEANVWPLVADGTVRPIVHADAPLDDVRRAHEIVEEGSHIGKVLLDVAVNVAPAAACRLDG